MLPRWTPTRRSVLKATGLSGLGAAANMTGVVRTGVAGAGVRALPALPAPQARLEESFTTGWKSVQLHTHANRVVAQLPRTSPRKGASHAFKPSDRTRYVRAQVEASDCLDIAWTPPAFR
jgi:hypothetical protein